MSSKPAKRPAKKAAKSAKKAAKRANPTRSGTKPAKKAAKRAGSGTTTRKRASSGSKTSSPKPADDHERTIGAAIRELLDAAALSTNAETVDRAIDALDLDDTDPKHALATLARRLARALDVDMTNAALVREYRMTLGALLDHDDDTDDDADPLEALRAALAD